MIPERSHLRLKDLKEKKPTASQLMNIRLPVEMMAAIEKLAKKIGANKTETIVALLNEALAGVGKKR